MRSRASALLQRAAGSGSCRSRPAGDRTGGVNKIFKYAYAIRHVGKKLKKRNRKLYYAAKWTIFAVILVVILAAIFVPWRML